MSTVGIIGLGNIGFPMSQNLLACGYDVIGFALERDERFLASGGRYADSVAHLGREAEVILQSLPSLSAITSSIDGLLESARPGQVLIDISSYPLDEKLKQANRLAEHGTVLLDCEVSGLPFMVANRTAVIFQSGDRATINRVEDIFKAMTDTRFYVGEFGSATKMKLLANAMVAIHNAVAAEVLNLASRSGLDSNLLVEAFRTSAAASVTFNNKAPIMLSRDFEKGAGPFSHMFHYLRRVAQMAGELGASTPLLDATRKLYDTAELEGREQQDIAALIEIIENASK